MHTIQKTSAHAHLKQKHLTNRQTHTRSTAPVAIAVPARKASRPSLRAALPRLRLAMGRSAGIILKKIKNQKSKIRNHKLESLLFTRGN